MVLLHDRCLLVPLVFQVDFKVLDLLVELVDLSLQSDDVALQVLRLALLVFVLSGNLVDLDTILLIFLLQGLELGLFLLHCDSGLIVLLDSFVLGDFSLSKGIAPGSQLAFKSVLLVDHLLNVVVGVDRQS